MVELERSPKQCPPFPPLSLQRACTSALPLLEHDCASLQATEQEDSISFAAFAVIDMLFKDTPGSPLPQTTAVLKDFLKMQYKGNSGVISAIDALDLGAAFTSNFMVGPRRTCPLLGFVPLLCYMPSHHVQPRCTCQLPPSRRCRLSHAPSVSLAALTLALKPNAGPPWTDRCHGAGPESGQDCVGRPSRRQVITAKEYVSPPRCCSTHKAR